MSEAEGGVIENPKTRRIHGCDEAAKEAEKRI